jgi:hypothetical protein
VATGRFQLSVVVAIAVVVLLGITSKESRSSNNQYKKNTRPTVILWALWCCEKSLLLGMSVLCQRVFLDTGYWVLVQPFAEVR